MVKGKSIGLTVMSAAWVVAAAFTLLDAAGWSANNQDGSGFVAGSVVVSTISGTPRATAQILVGIAILVAAVMLWAGIRQALLVLVPAAIVGGVLSASSWMPAVLAMCAVVGILPIFVTDALDQLWPPKEPPLQ